MTRYNNSKKNNYLANITSKQKSDEAIESLIKLNTKLKINLAYFEFDPSINQQQLINLVNKMKVFCGKSRNEWSNERKPTRNSKIFTLHGDFPEANKTKLKHPKGIPSVVLWATFRMCNMTRLAGFFIPPNSKNTNGNLLCEDTFYPVFYDLNHEFYTQDKK